jgi:hypothetical protein
VTIKRSLSRAACLLLRRGAASDAEKGQALPLFMLMIFVLTGSVAVVTDVSWFWVNQQKMQRAADAAALAGAVYLPGDVPGAYVAAQAAAVENGFTNGSAGVTVTPVQDSSNKRRLSVSVSGPVDTFFARTLGFNQANVAVTSRAEFTLPVPMGSPQNYYGVGEFLQTVTTTNSNNSATSNQRQPPTTTPSGTWTTPANAYGAGVTSVSANNAQQQWGSFGFQASVPNDPTLVVEGFQVRMTGVQLTGSGTRTSCKLAAELSWNAGASWSTSQSSPNLSTTAGNADIGLATPMTAWGAHSWTYADFSNANFRIRLTWTDGSATCQSTASVNVDDLDVQAYWHTVTTTSTTTEQVGSVPNPAGGSLTSQGFWGAILTRGGNRQNGDRYSPENNNVGPPSTPVNAEYDSHGYDYTIILNGTGTVKVFDPSFCETGQNSLGGFFGAGDHWIGALNAVTTVFTLWDENGTPYSTGDDIQKYTSGALFANQKQTDQGTSMGTPIRTVAGGYADCSTDPYHNAWWQVPGTYPSGRYRLNVNTSDAANITANAENGWSLYVTGGSNPQVYGESKMVAYNNLRAGTQQFYLAQIDAQDAGKTMEITLFDPGDVNGDAYLKLLSPNGNAYNFATFSYSSDNGRAGSASATQIQTASAGGGSYYNNSVLTIVVALPSTYGSTGLTPPGETQAGWWKVQYQVAGGNDTTTWEVQLRGSPVHLVP